MHTKTISKLSLMTLLASVSLSAVIAQAGSPVCKTIKECRKLEAKVKKRIQALTKAPNLGEIVKKADGSVWWMNQQEAANYCADHGYRLPNVLELALYSQSLGARGIMETAYPGRDLNDLAVQDEIRRMERDGFRQITSVNSLGQYTVIFYFDYLSYQAPAGELGLYVVWSSSFYSDHPNEAYALYSPSGHITSGATSPRGPSLAVRCVE